MCVPSAKAPISLVRTFAVYAQIVGPNSDFLDSASCFPAHWQALRTIGDGRSSPVRSLAHPDWLEAIWRVHGRRSTSRSCRLKNWLSARASKISWDTARTSAASTILCFSLVRSSDQHAPKIALLTDVTDNSRGRLDAVAMRFRSSSVAGTAACRDSRHAPVAVRCVSMAHPGSGESAARRRSVPHPPYWKRAGRSHAVSL